MNISSTIKSIQDVMRKDDGVDGDAQRLGQLTWMLFLKVFDQREEEWEEGRKAYESPLPERMRWRNWAAYTQSIDGKKVPQMSAAEVIGFVNSELFPALKALDESASPQHKVIRGVFEDANNYMKSGTQFLAVVEKLEEAINFRDFTTRANIGDVYEQLLNDLRGAGNAGEFYTPRAITQFMVQQVDPRLDKRETVMDPACGTGGFLTAAINHFSKQVNNKSKAYSERQIESLIRGIEKKQLPHLLCTTNMLLHGIEVPSQIDHKNTLGVGWDEWSSSEQVSCVVTNPPFGGYEDDGVGSDYPPALRSRETADMFMALIIEKLLKEGGRAAVVLPDGFLFGEGIKSTIKEMLLKHCKLHTVIRLPKGVFAPYTSIKTNLLFFTKGEKVDGQSDHFYTDTVWYYEHSYPVGYRSYSKTKPIQLDEFDPISSWWGSELDNFAARENYDVDPEIADKRAWKYDFAKAREAAVSAAQPYRDRVDALTKEAASLESRVRELRDSLKNEAQQSAHDVWETEVSVLRTRIESLRVQAREAQIAADRIYWPIYNLDRKNPHVPEEESHDPDVLLEKYKSLLGLIEDTENQLKSELAAALAHHFVAEGS